MTTSAWVTLVAVCGFIWGGALALVSIDMRKEARKPPAGSGQPEA